MQFLANLDTNTFLYLNGLTGHSSFFDSIVVFFAEYLPYILVVTIVWLVWKGTLDMRQKFYMLSVVFFSAFFARFGFASLIRFFYHRPRPFLAFHIQPLFPESSYSFPSGHASFFFALAFAIYFYNKKWGMWFLVATILITTARVIAGVHYTTDILGGAVVGLVSAYLTFKYLKPRLRS